MPIEVSIDYEFAALIGFDFRPIRVRARLHAGLSY
jgi:hypothetical protein